MRRIIPFFLVPLLLLVACSQPAPASNRVASLPTIAPTAVSPTATTFPTATLPPTETAVSPTATLPPTTTPSSTPDPYEPYTIQSLANREYGGGLLDIIDELEETETFTRYLITYPSDGLTIHGFMNVPHEGDNFPVALVLHGYIPPGEYDTVAYTSRYADKLAEAGYFVIHPNFRNYPPSDSGDDTYRTGMAIDVLNLIAIIREQSQDPYGYLRRANADDVNLWGHSMGGGIALRVIVVNNAEYVKTAVLYAAMSGDEAKNYGRIRQWSNGNRGDFELDATEEQLRAISPIYHLDRVNAAVSVHHSNDDDVVPVEWSEQLCELMEALEKPVECHFYNNQPHTFRGAGDFLFMDRFTTFFARH